MRDLLSKIDVVLPRSRRVVLEDGYAWEDKPAIIAEDILAMGERIGAPIDLAALERDEQVRLWNTALAVYFADGVSREHHYATQINAYFLRFPSGTRSFVPYDLEHILITGARYDDFSFFYSPNTSGFPDAVHTQVFFPGVADPAVRHYLLNIGELRIQQPSFSAGCETRGTCDNDLKEAAIAFQANEVRVSRWLGSMPIDDEATFSTTLTIDARGKELLAYLSPAYFKALRLLPSNLLPIALGYVGGKREGSLRECTTHPGMQFLALSTQPDTDGNVLAHAPESDDDIACSGRVFLPAKEIYGL